MKHLAEDVDALHLEVGERIDLESLRQTVVPPYVMLTPFMETPDSIEVEGQDGLEEDGVHGSVFHLRAEAPGSGELVVGFRDITTREVTHRKSIQVDVGARPADS